MPRTSGHHGVRSRQRRPRCAVRLKRGLLSAGYGRSALPGEYPGIGTDRPFDGALRLPTGRTDREATAWVGPKSGGLPPRPSAPDPGAVTSPTDPRWSPVGRMMNLARQTASLATQDRLVRPLTGVRYRPSCPSRPWFCPPDSVDGSCRHDVGRRRVSPGGDRRRSHRSRWRRCPVRSGIGRSDPDREEVMVTRPSVCVAPLLHPVRTRTLARRCRPG